MERDMQRWWWGICLAMFWSTVLASSDEVGGATNRVLRPTSEVLSKALMDPGFQPRLGTYTYRFHWLLKTGAESKVTVARVGDTYEMTTTAETGWFVDRIYRVRYRGVALLDAETLTPRRVELNEEIRSTRKDTVMEYRDGTLTSTRVKRKRKRDPSTRVYVQDTKGGQVMDYFSAVLIARAMAWSPGDVRTVEVFDGKGLSWAELTCEERTRVKTGMHDQKRMDVWKIRCRVVQGGEDLDEDDELIAEDIKLYLAADASREIVRIEAGTPFGDMKVVLDDFSPAPAEEAAAPQAATGAVSSL